MTSRPMKRLLYVLLWLPYGAAYAMLLLLSQRDIPVFSAVLSGWFVATTAMLLALPVRAAAKVMQRRHATLGAVILVGVVASVVFCTADTALMLTFLRLTTNTETLTGYIQTALQWEMLRSLVVGGLVFSVFTILDINARLRDERTRAKEAEEARIRAELQALRAQLDPHFLFNTINAMTSLARIDPVRCEQALLRFGALMRTVLDARRAERDEVSLDEELTFVRDYLALEQIRLGDRLIVEETIEDDALECVVPAMTLQPLVENAIRHGLAARSAGGTLAISAQIEGNELCITVVNDGNHSASTDGHRGLGVGLDVVRRRLHARHGDRAGLSTRWNDAGQWVVSVHLPIVLVGERPVADVRRAASLDAPNAALETIG